MLHAQIFTLYPELFPGPLNKGLYGKALSNNIWNLKVVNIRDYSSDKHKTVDDTPFGGGSGMLIKPDVLANSLDQNVKTNEKIYYLTPKGKLFSQKLAKKLSKEKTIGSVVLARSIAKSPQYINYILYSFANFSKNFPSLFLA